VTELGTIATRAQLAPVLALAHDVLAQHGRRLRVLFVDDESPTVDAEPFDRVSSSDVGLTRDDVLRLAMLFEPDDLMTALTPALLRALLDGGTDAAVFLQATSGDARIVAVRSAARKVLDDWARSLAALDPGEHPDIARHRSGAWMGRLSDHGELAVLEEPFAPSGPEHGRDAPLLALHEGTPIDRTMRALYRDAVVGAADGDHAPPNPLAPGGGPGFVEWLREPILPDLAPTVSRYLARVWSDSPVLRNEYPELDLDTAEAFEAWCRAHAGVPPWTLPSDAEREERRGRRRLARPRGPRPRGVNIVGYLDATLGLGEVARSLAEALAAAGVPVAAVANPATTSRTMYEFECVAPAAAPYDVNLFVVTADVFASLAGRLGPEFFAERRNIGLWFWEAERFRAGGPTPASAVLDEVWAPSSFVRGAVDAAALGVSVETVPIPVPVLEPPQEIDRHALGLPADRFLFLFAFDFFSVMERKNPIGLVDAYQQAFAPSDGAALVLKSINGDVRVDDLDALRAAAAGRPDIVVWDEYLAPERHAALLGQCDAYVSLHRAEGLGLTMAEAMALGKPVIATGYSGNLEFMNDEIAFLVGSTPTVVGEGVDPYPADAHWADPDLGHAARLMRHVFTDRAVAATVGRRAADAIRSQWSANVVGPKLAEHLEHVRTRPNDPDGRWRWFFTRGWRDRVVGRLPYAYRFDWLADGFALDRSSQGIFAYSLRRTLDGKTRDAPPDPDGPDATARMVQWLNAPIAPRRRPIVSRYLVQYWHDHAELQERFPAIETDRGAAASYLQWLGEHWHAETDIDYRLVPGR
jgi:Glycosyl transferases group 1